MHFEAFLFSNYCFSALRELCSHFSKMIMLEDVHAGLMIEKTT